MREIKFRAWDGKKMHIWGFTPDGFTCPPHANFVGPTKMVHMQFTSLHDKNGKEIYEKDIIKPAHSEPMPVCFDESLAMFAWLEMDNSFYEPTYDDWENCEVIGNFYENPDLIGCEEA